MEMLLKGDDPTSRNDVIYLRNRMKDGCKVSYISNARVTGANVEDWMALPLVEEDETEATCSRQHFLLMHVPSLREFVHKFDALPPLTTAEGGRQIKQEDGGQREIKKEDPDIDTNSLVEASVITTVSSAFTADYDDAIDEEGNLKTGRSTSPMKRLPHSVSPFFATDSSSFEEGDTPSAEDLESSHTQNDITDLSDYFVPAGTDFLSAVAPDTTQTPSPSPNLPICTYKIEPAPAVDCGVVETIAVEDPTESLMTLIARATAAAAAVMPAPETDAMLCETKDVVDLPPVRRLSAVPVKKQMSVQSPCPRCYVMIEKLDDMRAHIEDGACTQIGAHACDVCGKRLSSKWTLKKHVERHSDRPRCAFCSNRFDSADELRDHNLLSGHMFRPEEASAGSLELSQLRKQRRKEHEDAARARESVNNLASIVAALDSVAAGAATAASETQEPTAKKRKTSGLEDETASAVACLLAEEEAEEGDE